MVVDVSDSVCLFDYTHPLNGRTPNGEIPKGFFNVCIKPCTRVW